MLDRPVVARAHIIMELILEKLTASEPVEQSLDAHPRLAREVALAFAQET
jgi:uncharacterized protein (DUF433 family)